MNKAEFVSYISETNDCSKTDATKALDMVVDSIMSALGKGEKVHLVGFGSFEAQHRPARKGRNPKTGAEMNIEAYNQPSFKAGKKLKESCN